MACARQIAYNAARILKGRFCMNWCLPFADESPSNALWIIGLVVIVIIFLVLFAVFFQFIELYVQAMSSGARVSLLELIGMRLRKVNAVVIVRSRIQALRAGLQVTQAEMESH